MLTESTAGLEPATRNMRFNLYRFVEHRVLHRARPESTLPTLFPIDMSWLFVLSCASAESAAAGPPTSTQPSGTL